MKTRSFLYKMLLFVMLLILNYNIKAQSIDKEISELKWVKETGAKTTPVNVKVYKVNDYGAKNDRKTLNTKEIQATIDACSANGGGTVAFDSGAYITGSIYIKKNVNLLIAKGVEILGSLDLSDYPEIDTRVAGIEMKWPSALINILDHDNVALTGDCIVHANGKSFWDKYLKMRKDYDAK